MNEQNSKNLDGAVVDGFGDEWSHYDQSKLSVEDKQSLFAAYFSVFPWGELPVNAVGADVGCGSGRWASLVAGRVGRLHCVEPADKAIAVAKRNLSGQDNCEFHNVSVDDMSFADGSLDFAYSLGVLHHIPDTAAAMKRCVRTLKPGAPFLVYLYYAMENRPAWFRLVWRVSDLVRRAISWMPRPLVKPLSLVLALVVYWPLSRLAWLGEKLGFNVSAWPLSAYRDKRLYVLATDSLDRFGTRLEHRFTREEIQRMMESAGLTDIRFSETEPFWTAVGKRA